MQTEQKNCTFYWKIGACRLGDRCSHLHQKPAYSQTIMIRHMYPNPRGANYVDQDGILRPFTNEFLREYFDNFYADVFKELETKHGLTIEDLYVCDNTCEHMFGNVYISFANIEDAKKCFQLMKGRFYAGRMLVPEYSPVLDFSEAKCRPFERGGEEQCPKGANCNNIHPLKPSEDLLKHLLGETRYELYKQKHETPTHHDHYHHRGGSSDYNAPYAGGGQHRHHRPQQHRDQQQPPHQQPQFSTPPSKPGFIPRGGNVSGGGGRYHDNRGGDNRRFSSSSGSGGGYYNEQHQQPRDSRHQGGGDNRYPRSDNRPPSNDRYYNASTSPPGSSSDYNKRKRREDSDSNYGGGSYYKRNKE
ncbi:hypothetical protein C9374_008731 [Naegleria lovaniensis]|uniref:C3H1-type domain-containing protein n=1 Tax=Naegleria lovaniensis TaxID=51637 RepID=A0AA88GIH7_NAELO|nr:uncharacterized protein C9374_008731 [Naegleria lovaniensis]KAG2378109.1 hypothetical protein C9374_008731 [Naegleria lovaniensis]